MGPLLSAVGLLAIVLLVLAGAWAFTRWAGKNLGGGFAGRNGNGRVQVLDRVNLDRERAILLVRAGERYLLLGSAPGGLTLLAELTKEEGENWNPPPPVEDSKNTDFLTLLRRLREK